MPSAGKGPHAYALGAEDFRLALRAAAFMENELGVPLEGGRFLLAVSGGSDSVALLLLFSALRSRGASICAAHLDHALRSESAGEAELVKELCDSLGVPCTVRREPVAEKASAWGCGIEEAARRVRYAFLEECRLKTGSGWVLTAHHAGDLAEDALMRLVRGASWPALGGMKGRVEEPGRRLLRPLLMEEKERLRAVPEGMGVRWAEDATNAEPCCLRNRIRLEFMPLFLRENPSFHDAVRRMWKCARLDEEAFAAMREECLELRGAAALPDTDGPERTECGASQGGPSVFLSAKALAGRSRADFGRLAAEAVRCLRCGQARESVIEDMLRAWERRLFPRRFSFPGGVKAEMDAKGILFHIAPGR